MSIQGKTLRICNCNQTMKLDAAALGRALKSGKALKVESELCRRQISEFEAALKGGEEVVVGCTQEAPLFEEVAERLGYEGRLSFVNIREQAGWSQEAGQAGPKIAALIAAAALPAPEPVARIQYKSEGRLLVIGQAGAALYWAERLAQDLEVAVLVNTAAGSEPLPATRRYPVWSGKRVSVTGHLGAFRVAWEQDNPIDLEACTRCGACIRACPERAIDFSYQVDLGKCRAHRKCVAACGDIRAIDFERHERERGEAFDLVLDLSAQPALTMHQPPRGYAAPGGDPLEQSLAAAELSRLVGEFEKPRYFEWKASLCAHARNEITGCSRCLEVCSTSAISGDGNHVKVDPQLCMGCGGCTTVCPSGALTYAYPRVADLGTRIRTLLATYREAGGADACLLFHNGGDGRELIERLGREGRGLPARVIPVEVFHVAPVGMDLVLGGFAYGAAQVIVLSAGSEAPEYLAALREQMGLAETLVRALGWGGDHFGVMEVAAWRELEQRLWGLEKAAACANPGAFHLSNVKRTTLEFAIEHLAKQAPAPQHEISLAAGAPYGAILVSKAKCTMCLACVGACPERALQDGKEVLQLRFIERNCVQCGLCARTCPEEAITLQPRLLLSREWKEPRVVNEADLFCCSRCGKPLGARPMIEKMLASLKSHSMFVDPAAHARLAMCAECRVVDLMKNEQSASITGLKS